MASLALLSLIAGLAVGSSDTQIRITGVEQQRQIACDGRGVVVEGVDHDLTFTGGCASLKLKGSGSKIMIDLKPGAPVAVSGTDLTVRWRSARAPTVSISGVDNSVSKAP